MADVVTLDAHLRGGPKSAPSPTPSHRRLSRIALVGNYPPRRCGIATFTRDSRDALVAAQPDLAVDVYAMDDGQNGLNFDLDISHLRQNVTADYYAAAERINQSGADIVWLQHEFGIFGGLDGGLIVYFLGKIEISVAVTLHTILEKPSPNQRRIMDAIIARADLLIVMAEKGREILARCYGVPEAKIAIIPHGIPDRPYILPEVAKEEFGFEGRAVILTFGLLSPEKGIADMIEAMPEIVAATPEALYVVLGATHPHVIAHSGNTLREGLQARVGELALSGNVKFVDDYVDLDLLTRYLQAADVYVTPYHNPDQITSGTLSYAVGLGKPVVSTGYVHARELLGDGTGAIVPFRSPDALARSVSNLLTNDARRDQLARRAYRIGRSMTWDRYAAAAITAFQKLAPEAQSRVDAATLPSREIVGIAALERLTDDNGMAQHSRFGVTDRRHGYCVDDNARALALVSVANDMPFVARAKLGHIYAAFVQHAWNADIGAFRNFMHFDRHWLEDQGSSDSNGRTLLALAVCAAHHPDPLLREWANELYREAHPRVAVENSPRAIAFSVLAAVTMQQAGLSGSDVLTKVEKGAQHLLTMLAASRRDDWIWFESVLAYDNCRLPEALLRAGHLLEDDDLVSAGLESLGWIMRLQTAEQGWFKPIGSTSFGRAYEKPLPFDQQPIEALSAIDACVAAAEHEPAAKWAAWGEAAFAWFSGANDLGLALADLATGECCDGLTLEGRNANRGAESVLAWQAAARQVIRLRAMSTTINQKSERAFQ